MNKKLLLVLLVFSFFSGMIYFKNHSSKINKPNQIARTMDAKVCEDGTSVGRVPPDCEFEACPINSDEITVSYPRINQKITSPIEINGKATGKWYFEAQFSVELIDDNGNKMGTAILTAEGNWMTEDYVPYSGTLYFDKPNISKGYLKLMSSNPSGLPENQRTMEVPVSF